MRGNKRVKWIDFHNKICARRARWVCWSVCFFRACDPGREMKQTDTRDFNSTEMLFTQVPIIHLATLSLSYSYARTHRHHSLATALCCLQDLWLIPSFQSFTLGIYIYYIIDATVHFQISFNQINIFRWNNSFHFSAALVLPRSFSYLICTIGLILFHSITCFITNGTSPVKRNMCNILIWKRIISSFLLGCVWIRWHTDTNTHARIIFTFIHRCGAYECFPYDVIYYNLCVTVYGDRR